MPFYSLFPSQQFFPQSSYNQQDDAAPSENAPGVVVERYGSGDEKVSNRKSSVSDGRIVSRAGQQDPAPELFPRNGAASQHNAHVQKAAVPFGAPLLHQPTESESQQQYTPHNPQHMQQPRTSTANNSNTLNLIEKLEMWNLSETESSQWGSSFDGRNSTSSNNTSRLSSSSDCSLSLSDALSTNRMSNSSIESFDYGVPTLESPAVHSNRSSIENQQPPTQQPYKSHKSAHFQTTPFSQKHQHSKQKAHQSAPVLKPPSSSSIIPNHSRQLSSGSSQNHRVVYDNTNIFVKHLPPSVDNAHLRSLFQPFGRIISCKVMLNIKTGSSLGYGFVRFQDSGSAQVAIQKMTGFRIGKKKLLCKLSNKAFPQQYGSVTEPRNNLYVKHLPISYDNQKLRALFEPYGKIKEVKVMMDKHTGLSKQIGFVRYERQVDATRALYELNNILLEEEEGCVTPLNVHYAETSSEKRMRQVQQQVRLSMSQQFLANQQQKSTSSDGPSTSSDSVIPFSKRRLSNKDKKRNSKNHDKRGKKDRNEKDDKANLFIFHLPQDVKDSELYALFSPFGTVESVRVMTDKNGQSKGFGFVKYTQFSDALDAITAMNGFKLGKKHIKVSFKQS